MNELGPMIANGPARSKHRLVLAHGAGAPMDSPFMNFLAEGLGSEKIRVVRFEFPYMRIRRESGARRPPDRAPILLQCWRDVVGALGRESTLHIGGKSMGGRIASMVADELGVRGLVCLGYPFHPPGKPDKVRTEHLMRLRTESWFGQGERDALGSRTEVERYGIASTIRLHWFPDGDHSFKPGKRSGWTEEGHLNEAIEQIAAFIRRPS